MHYILKYALSFLLVVNLPGLCISQQEYVDSQAQGFLYCKGKLDSLEFFIKSGKVIRLQECEIISHERFSVAGLSWMFSRQVLKMSQARRNKYAEMMVLNENAFYFYQQKKYDTATIFWAMSLKIAEDEKFEAEDLHQLRIALNNNCFLSGDYTDAMRFSAEGLAIAEKLGDRNRMAHFNNVIGYIYMKLGNYAEGEKYFQQYLILAGRIKDSILMAHAFYNLGDLAISTKEYKKAIDLFGQSLYIYKLIKYKVAVNNAEREAYVSNKLAQCYKLSGNLKLARELIRSSLNVTNSPRVNAYDKSEYLINAADIYNRIVLPDSAIFFGKNGLSIAQSINHREDKRDALEQLSIAYYHKKFFDSAFLYQQAYSKLKDSIVNEISLEEIYQREANLRIERQQQLQKIAIQKQKTRQNIISAIGIMMLITLSFLYNSRRLKQKNDYQKELNRQQNELFNAVAVAQDQERKRIAEDIHDSLGSLLSAAKLKLSSLMDDPVIISGGQEEKFSETLQLLDEASSELRNISHNIMPATLSKLGLIAALRNLINTLSSHSGITIRFSAHDFEERMEENMEMSIYRIVLELINNVLKHAAATRLTVQMIRFPEYINLSVEDNGRGFDYDEELFSKKGIGLSNILSRIDYLKGTLHVDTGPARGTTVIIDLPCNSKA